MNKEENFDDALSSVISSIADSFDAEIVSKSQNELDEYWFFIWDDNSSIQWNTYQFFDLLGLYKRACRKWEEAHFGSVCVVERVRDKYLIPKINAFLLELHEKNTK